MFGTLFWGTEHCLLDIDTCLKRLPLPLPAALLPSVNPNPHRVFSKHPAKCNRMHTVQMRTLLNATTCILLHCAGNSYALAFVPSAYPAKCNILQGWILLHCAVNPFIPALLQQNPGCIPNTKPAKCNRLHQTRRLDLPAKCNNLQQVFYHWCILLQLAGLGLMTEVVKVRY